MTQSRVTGSKCGRTSSTWSGSSSWRGRAGRRSARAIRRRRRLRCARRVALVAGRPVGRLRLRAVRAGDRGAAGGASLVVLEDRGRRRVSGSGSTRSSWASWRSWRRSTRIRERLRAAPDARRSTGPGGNPRHWPSTRRRGTLLVEELGIDPMPELQALERAILVQDPALEVARPQTASARRRRASLPRPPTPLVGRERELAELEELVLAQRLRDGAPAPAAWARRGSRSRFCERLQDSFEEGVRFVQLAAPPTRSLCRHRSPRARAGGAARRELTDTIAGALQESELVLCLDNLEQLLRGGGVRRRAALPLPGPAAARRQPLRPSPRGRARVPAAAAHRRGRGDSRRSCAFCLSGFADPGPGRSVAAICERLDRLRLALELAAARVGSWPLLHAGAARQGPGALAGGARTSLSASRRCPRRSTGAISSLLRRAAALPLAVHVRRGFSLEAATAVAEQDELRLIERLSVLVEHSLVRRAEVDGEPRRSVSSRRSGSTPSSGSRSRPRRTPFRPVTLRTTASSPSLRTPGCSRTS